MSNEASRSIDISALNEDSPFHRLLGLTVTGVTPGEVEVVMPSPDRLLANTTSPYVHGGAIATLIDVAGNFAVIAAIDRDIPTIDLRVDYLRPVRKGALRAVGRTVKVAGRWASPAGKALKEAGKTWPTAGGPFGTAETQIAVGPVTGDTEGQTRVPTLHNDLTRRR